MVEETVELITSTTKGYTLPRSLPPAYRLFHLTPYYGVNINFRLWVKTTAIYFPSYLPPSKHCLGASVESRFHIFPIVLAKSPSCTTLYVNKHYLINRWRRPFELLLADFELDLLSFDVMQDQINDKSFESRQRPFRTAAVFPFFPACFSLKKETRFITSPLTWAARVYSRKISLLEMK